MIVTALIASAATTICYLLVLGRFSKRSLYLMTGYGVWIDLLFTLFIIGMAATSGTAVALIISAFTGLFLSFALILLRKYLGYSKISRIKGTWFKFKFVNYPPTLELPKWLSKIQSYIPTVDKAYA